MTNINLDLQRQGKHQRTGRNRANERNTRRAKEANRKAHNRRMNRRGW